MSSDRFIDIKDLTKIYGARTILNIDKYAFSRGMIYGLVGPNGSGKTTLLLLLAHLIQPTGGSIFLDGIDTTHLSPSETRKRITLVHQEPIMFGGTVKGNVSVGPGYRDLSNQQVKQQVAASLSAVGMSGLVQRRARTLSGGEKKRVAIARALAIGPEVLLLDEPTANVDVPNAVRIEEIIKSVNQKNGTTVIFTTHNMSQAHRLSHSVIGLVNGKINTGSLKNIFFGAYDRIDGEPAFFTGHIHIKLPENTDSVRQVSIDPEHIIVSKDPVDSSARNRFSGKIIEMRKDGSMIEMVVAAGEDFTVAVTERSYKEMGLFIGQHVHLAFKASSVTLHRVDGG